ncbi:MAG: hypothetical protein ACTHMO_07045 [Rhodanobacteraceae bacterium]
MFPSRLFRRALQILEDLVQNRLGGGLMVGDMDFLALYQELGITPGTCNLTEFKLAYRRRMQQLHPDRNPEVGEDSAPDSLHHLMAVYREAIAFERRFGRLPGAEPPGGRRTGVTAQTESPGPRHAVAAMPLGDGRWPWRRLIFAALVLLTLGWVLWGVGLIVF